MVYELAKMTTLSLKFGSGGDSNRGQLLRDIEEISKALYLPKSHSRPLISFLNLQSESTQYTHLPCSISKLDHGEEKIKRDNRSSIWPWKPFKAISHIWRRKFKICFLLMRMLRITFPLLHLSQSTSQLHGHQFMFNLRCFSYPCLGC